MSQNEAGTLTCPSCYNITPDCTPSQLPKHIKKEREVSASKLQQSGERLCGSCDDNNKAEAYCQDCIYPLCSECVASHKRLKPFKSHTLVSLDTAKPLLPPISCPLHPKECFKYYCLTCSRLICADCIIEHTRHRFVLIDEAASIEMKYLRDSMSKVEDSIPSVNNPIKEISSIVKVVREDKVKSQEQLDRTFEEISTAIKNCYDQLSKELEDIAIAKTTQLEMQKEDLEKITANLELALSMGNDVCTTYSKIEALSVKQSVVHALKNVLDQINPTSFHPVCTGGPVISVNHFLSVENFVLSIAKIRSMSQYPPLCSLVDVDPKVVIGVARNCNCLLILQTRNSRGEDLEEGGATVKATIKNTSAGKYFNCKVNDLQNGKYEILFTSAPSFFRSCDDIGELHITVDDTAIQDSPYNIKFINYNRAISPSETFAIDDAPEYLDSAGNLLYITTNQGDILVYENDTGNFDLKLTKIISKSGGISRHLRGIAIDQVIGVMFFAGANKVIKADLNGNVIATVGGKGTDQLEFKFSTGVCLTKEGLLLIGDCANTRVQVLNSDMSFNQFIECRTQVWGVAVDPGDNIHVGTTDCVEVFDINGDEITEYGLKFLYKAGDIQFPNFQQPSDCKYSFVTECRSIGEIFFFNWKTNTVLQRITTGSHPLGLRIDQSGDMTVCCYKDKEIQMFIW